MAAISRLHQYGEVELLKCCNFMTVTRKEEFKACKNYVPSWNYFHDNRIYLSYMGGVELDNISIKKYLEKINEEKEQPLTIGNLITNCIVSSKRLICELEKIEDKVLTANKKDQNNLILLGAELENIIQEIKIITTDIF